VVEVIRTRRAVTSYQVVQEFLYAAVRSAIPGFGVDEGRTYLRESFARFEIGSPSLGLYEETLSLQAQYRFHWYDSLIVAVAIEAGCETLYTEDLQHGQKIGTLMVVNPFV